MASTGRWWEISPYASVVARVSERERWIIKDMNEGLDWTCHSFALRPPSFGKQHTAAATTAGAAKSALLRSSSRTTGRLGSTTSGTTTVVVEA